MTGDRSISAGGNIQSSAIVTGDNSSGIAVNSGHIAGGAPIKDIEAMAALLGQLQGIDQRAIHDLASAKAELEKPNPDKSRIRELVVQAARYAKLTSGFADAYDHIVPHLQGIAAWLGDSWDSIQSMLK